MVLEEMLQIEAKDSSIEISESALYMYVKSGDLPLNNSRINLHHQRRVVIKPQKDIYCHQMAAANLGHPLRSF